MQPATRPQRPDQPCCQFFCAREIPRAPHLRQAGCATLAPSAFSSKGAGCGAQALRNSDQQNFIVTSPTALREPVNLAVQSRQPVGMAVDRRTGLLGLGDRGSMCTSTACAAMR